MRKIHADLMARQHQRSKAADWQADHYIQSVLRYLDSSTDYREYLPRAGSRRFLIPPKSEFVTLDNDQFDWGKTGITIILTVFICTILLLWMKLN
jgi:hypothetical protein